MESGNSLLNPLFLRPPISTAIFFYENFRASLDVYIEDNSFELKCGTHHCIWTVQEDGFYLYYTYLHTNKKMHDWNK